MEIKKIKILSLANIAGLLYALLGFLVFFAEFIYSLVKVILEKDTTGRLAYYILVNLGLAFLSSLVVAIIAGAAGWLIGLIAASWYNFLAREIGGVKIELAEEAEQEEIIVIEKKSSFIKVAEDKGKQELFKY